MPQLIESRPEQMHILHSETSRVRKKVRRGEFEVGPPCLVNPVGRESKLVSVEAHSRFACLTRNKCLPLTCVVILSDVHLITGSRIAVLETRRLVRCQLGCYMGMLLCGAKVIDCGVTGARVAAVFGLDACCFRRVSSASHQGASTCNRVAL